MAGQFGLVSETAWSTALTPSKFFEVLSANQTVDEGYMRRAGIRAVRRLPGPPKLGKRAISGQGRMELPNTGGAATLLKHLFGAVTTTGAGPYSHAYELGDQVGTLKSLTIQTGIGDATGTVQPFTHRGSKIHQWELGLQVGEFAMLAIDWTATDATTATALAAASYSSTLNPFTFVEGSVSVAGTVVASARAATLRGNKGLRTDRFVLGSRLIREQLEKDKWSITGSVTCDFENLTLFNLAADATEVAFVFTLDNGTHSFTVTSTATITGDAPSLTTNGLEEQTLNFEIESATTDAAGFSAVLVNDEASAA